MKEITIIFPITDKNIQKMEYINELIGINEYTLEDMIGNNKMKFTCYVTEEHKKTIERLFYLS